MRILAVSGSLRAASSTARFSGLCPSWRPPTWSSHSESLSTRCPSSTPISRRQAAAVSRAGARRFVIMPLSSSQPGVRARRTGRSQERARLARRRRRNNRQTRGLYSHIVPVDDGTRVPAGDPRCHGRQVIPEASVAVLLRGRKLDERGMGPPRPFGTPPCRDGRPLGGGLEPSGPASARWVPRNGRDLPTPYFLPRNALFS